LRISQNRNLYIGELLYIILQTKRKITITEEKLKHSQKTKDKISKSMTGKRIVNSTYTFYHTILDENYEML